MAGVTHDCHQVANRFAQRSRKVSPVVYAELQVQSQAVARVMREKVAKFRSHTANSINAQDTAPLEITVAPGTEYASAIEKGVKPGGKGLPRFFDPASADIVAWLQTKLRGGGSSPARGSAAFQSAELQLRNRYEGLAWHIRRYGVKAQPFVAPTAQEMGPPVAAALKQAVLDVLQGKSRREATPVRVSSPRPKAKATPKAASPVVSAGAPMTWKQFQKANMGAAMKAAMAGGVPMKEAHGAAMRQLGADWRAFKAGKR